MKVKMHLVAKRKNPAAKQTDRAALLPRPGMSCNKKSGQTAFLNSCIHCFDVDVRVAEKRSGQTAFLHFCILRFCRRLWHPSIILLTCTKWYGTGHCELEGRVGGGLPTTRQHGGEQVEKSHNSLVRSFARVGGRGGEEVSQYGKLLWWCRLWLFHIRLLMPSQFFFQAQKVSGWPRVDTIQIWKIQLNLECKFFMIKEQSWWSTVQVPCLILKAR